MKTKSLIPLQCGIRASSDLGQSKSPNELINRARQAVSGASTVNGFVRLNSAALKTVHRLKHGFIDSARKINFNNSLLVSLDC